MPKFPFRGNLGQLRATVARPNPAEAPVITTTSAERICVNIGDLHRNERHFADFRAGRTSIKPATACTATTYRS
jgi:hypothetical protein